MSGWYGKHKLPLFIELEYVIFDTFCQFPKNFKICPFFQSAKKGILERLNEGPVIGDGGFVFALEKRGYVKAGPWTPEATVEHPEAGMYQFWVGNTRNFR